MYSYLVKYPVVERVVPMLIATRNLIYDIRVFPNNEVYIRKVDSTFDVKKQKCRLFHTNIYTICSKKSS